MRRHLVASRRHPGRDLCTEWLDRECWRPDDGAAEAACVVWAAAKLVDEEAVRAWVAARRPT